AARQSLPAPALLFEKFLLPDELDRRWHQAADNAKGAGVFERFLGEMGIGWECPEDELARIPKQGPIVVVANHPFGLAEGALLGALLARVRPDVKVLANSLLADAPGLHDFTIAVNPFGGAAKENWRALRQSVTWLKNGGALAAFPAGEV